MTPFEISICQEVLQNCWGLKDSFEKYPEEAIKELSQMTGIREKYIKEHINEILA